jgi:hypothetical protein
MRFVLAILMAGHGIAHLPGFLVNWQLRSFPEMPYRTTIFGTSLDLGDAGIKVIGALWLAAGVSFVVLAGATLTRVVWWPPVGDRVRLTPDPYFGQPGQFMTVAEIHVERALVFRQTLPNGSPASWAFLLQPEDHGRTRVVMRRRGGDPTLFDRVMAPGYAFMDRGMLHGLRQRAEGTAF